MNLNTIASKEIIPGFHGKLVRGDTISWAFWTVDQDAVATRTPAYSWANDACCRRRI